MGNACQPEPSPEHPDLQFHHVDSGSTSQMVQLGDEPKGNLEQNQKHAHARPNYSFGKRVLKRPKISVLAQQTRERELKARQLEGNKEQGIKLPVHYVYRYAGYYDGQWSHGLPNGHGKIYFNNGAYFEGHFHNGQITCQDGLYILPDGSFKRGNVVQGKMQGFGVYINRDRGFRYEGYWKNDKPNGKGVESYADGSNYEGEFVNGLKWDENGTYRWKNGKIYTGQFRNGYMEGEGKLYWPEGKGEYIGEFSRNLIVGHGRMKTQTGIYEGTFEHGLMQGKGQFHWYDGKVYKGDFYQGQLHGKGLIIYPYGQVVEGEWHYGENLKMDSIKNRPY